MQITPRSGRGRQSDGRAMSKRDVQKSHHFITGVPDASQCAWEISGQELRVGSGDTAERRAGAARHSQEPAEPLLFLLKSSALLVLRRNSTRRLGMWKVGVPEDVTAAMLSDEVWWRSDGVRRWSGELSTRSSSFSLFRWFLAREKSVMLRYCLKRPLRPLRHNVRPGKVLSQLICFLY